MSAKILQVNITNARKNLYTLLDKVLKDDFMVILSKEGVKEKAIIQKISTKYTETETTTDSSIVRDTCGAIKTTGYDSNENQKAKEIFVKNYKE